MQGYTYSWPVFRPVKFELISRVDSGPIQKNTFDGKFHTWAQRGDESGIDFFGVIETEDGKCLELDPSQIQFTDV